MLWLPQGQTDGDGDWSRICLDRSRIVNMNDLRWNNELMEHYREIFYLQKEQNLELRSLDFSPLNAVKSTTLSKCGIFMINDALKNDIWIR